MINLTNLQRRKLSIFGILNLTPNSFSDGGQYFSKESAVQRIEEMISDNTEVIDIGAESTAPNTLPITHETEIQRLNCIIDDLSATFSNAIFSIDTRYQKTAEIAIKKGFQIINDTSFGRGENMLQFAAESGSAYVLTHSLSSPAKKGEIMKETGEEMLNKIHQDSEKIINKFISLGGQASQIIFDPGIGFGKNEEQSIFIIKNIEKLKSMLPQCAMLIGHSRKRVIKHIFTKINDTSNDLEAPTNLELDYISNSITAYLYGKVEFARIHNTKLFKETIGSLGG